jgi:hypothetical protein
MRKLVKRFKILLNKEKLRKNLKKKLMKKMNLLKITIKMMRLNIKLRLVSAFKLNN